MEFQQKKRKRNPNWEEVEKKLLREVIDEKVHIIENKNTDTNTNNKKKVAWEDILKCFNELNTKDRCLVELKQQWRAIKVEAKKKKNIYKKALKATGGGCKPPSPHPDTIKIMEMVPLEFEEGTNEYDCDTITQLENHPDPNLEDIVEEINEIPMEDTQSPLKSTNSNIPPTPRIKKLKAKEKSRLNRDIALVQMLQEEHNLKVKNMREAHEWAEEEHKLKVKKLKLENMLLEVQLNSTI